MTDLTWTAIRADTIDRFHGQTPRPEDEASIIDVFELHPQLVLRAIDETAAALDAGKITWAWAVVKSRLERGTSAVREATANTTQSKLKAIERAKTWIRNAGCQYELEQHVRGDLFGDEYASGMLSDTNLTDQQKDELIAYWHEQRPRGIEAERLHLEYMTQLRQAAERRAEILKRKKTKAPEGDPCPPSPSQPASKQTTSTTPSTTSPSTSTTPTSTTPKTTSDPASSPSNPSSQPKPDPVAVDDDITW